MYTLCSSNIAENHYRQLNLFLNKPWVVDLVVFPVSNRLSIGQVLSSINRAWHQEKLIVNNSVELKREDSKLKARISSK